MALIITLSVMNGFEREMRSSILNMVAHITVKGPYGKSLEDWQSLAKKVEPVKDVIGSAPYAERKGLLTGRYDRVDGANLRGIIPEYEKTVSKVGDNMLFGSLDELTSRSYNIILGDYLADYLNVQVGDRVIITSTARNNTMAGSVPREKAFNVVGIFKVGFYEYDRYVALIHLDDLNRFYRLNNKVDGLQVQTVDIFQVDGVADNINAVIDCETNSCISDWREVYPNWFNAVKMEKILISLLLFLIILVAAINVISSLVMVVSTKKSDIAILRTYGVSKKQITRIFMIQGSFIGVVGNLIGGLLGVLISVSIEPFFKWLGDEFDIHLIDPSVYFIGVLPSEVHWDQVIYIISASLIVSILATIIPARLASRTQPAEALRYE